MRAAKRPPTTIRTRTQHIRQLHAETKAPAPRDLDLWDLMEWIASHEDWKPNSAYAARSSLRTFYAWAHAAGVTPTNPAAALPKIRRGDPNPHPLPDDLMADLLRRADRRERLMILLAGQAGLRRGEVAQVHTRDVVMDGGGWSIYVHGKGAKERTVPLVDAVAREILRHPPGFIFPGQIDGHLSPLWVGKLISDLLPDGWSMHSLRHRFATRAYSVDHDLLIVQKLLGHASLNTTRAYVQIDHDRMRTTVLAAA